MKPISILTESIVGPKFKAVCCFEASGVVWRIGLTERATITALILC